MICSVPLLQDYSIFWRRGERIRLWRYSIPKIGDHHFQFFSPINRAEQWPSNELEGHGMSETFKFCWLLGRCAEMDERLQRIFWTRRTHSPAFIYYAIKGLGTSPHPYILYLKFGTWLLLSDGGDWVACDIGVLWLNACIELVFGATVTSHHRGQRWKGRPHAEVGDGLIKFSALATPRLAISTVAELSSAFLAELRQLRPRIHWQ